MILLHIGTHDENQCNEIIDFLEDEKLIVDALIIETVRRTRKAGETKKSPYFLILAKTKALLFNSVDQLMIDNYPDNLPSIYSTPIVNMDWDQTKDLREMTAKV